MGIIVSNIVITGQDQTEQQTPSDTGKNVQSFAELRSSLTSSATIEEEVIVETNENAGAKKSQYMLDMFNSDELISFDEEE